MNNIDYRIKPTVNTSAEVLAEITLVEIKSHLRISWSTEDTLLTSLLLAAYNIAEGYTGLSLCYKTYNLYLDRFPNANEDEWIDLLHSCGRLTVSHVKYYDTSNVQQTWSQWTDYDEDEPGLTWARLYPVVDKVFPSTADRHQAVEVEYITGFIENDDYDLPFAIKAAILIILANLYEHRQDEVVGRITSELPMTAKHLLDPYRMINI